MKKLDFLFDYSLQNDTENGENVENEEEIDIGNVSVGNTALAPGTTTPTQNNVNTDVKIGDTNVEIITPGENTDSSDVSLQQQMLNITQQADQLDSTNGDLYGPNKGETKGLELFFDENQTTEDQDLQVISNVIQEETDREVKKIVENNLPKDKAVDFTNQDSLDKFTEKTFNEIINGDIDISTIQSAILEENQEIIDAKKIELKEVLKKYETFVFPENYFSSISQAFGVEMMDMPAFEITPQQEEMEAEIENATKKYTSFINELIKKDPRFIDRVSYLEKSLFNVLEPQVEAANKIKTKSDIRIKRQKAELFGAKPDSIDNLGFGINSVAIVQFLSGSDEDSWVRGLEKFFGYNPYEISDSVVAGLETLSTDKFTQSLLMDDFAADMDYYNSYTMEADEYNNRPTKYEHGKGNNKRSLYSRKHHLPYGDVSLVWYNEKTGEWKPIIGNYKQSIDGKHSGPLYSNPAVPYMNENSKMMTSGQFLKAAEKKGFKLMRFGEARDLIAADLDKKQSRILDRAVQLMNKESEKGVFTQEKFTDFLTNVAQGNIKDAIRYLPKVVLKQVPYMAANFFSAGLYTMVSEGGNIGFDIAQKRAAKSLNKDISEVTGEELLLWIENNPEEFDEALTGGMGAGGAIAGLERAGIGYMIKSAKFGMSAFAQVVKGNLNKALRQSKAAFGQNLKSGVNESLTEGTQTAVEQVAVGRFNAMEYVEAMGEGGIGGFILPGFGSVAVGTITTVVDLAKNTRLNIRDPKLYSKAKILFEKQRTQLDADLKSGKIDDKTYDERLTKASNERNTLLKIPSYFNVEGKQESFNILTQIMSLQSELNTIGDPKGLGKPIVDEITSLNERLQEVFAEQGLNRQIGSLEALTDPKTGNVSMQVFDSTVEANNFIDQQNESGNWNQKASKDGSGLILQNKQTGEQLIIVDKQKAAEVRDIAVADHEFLHALMFQTVKDSPKAAAAIGKSLLGYLEKMDKDGQMTNLLKERYKEYKNKPIEQQYEEALNFFADAIINEQIPVNDSIVKKIGRVIRNLLQSLPFVNIKFKSNKDVYNFVKDYALRRKAGKGLNAAQKRMLTKSAIVGENLGEGTSSQIADIIENQAGNLDTALESKSNKSAQDLMLQYQQEGADMDIDLTQDLINQYYSLGLKAMGYSKQAGDIQVKDALNFLNSEFPSIARNFAPESGSLSNYIRNTIGQRGRGFFKEEIERKKRTVSKEKLEDKGRQIVDTTEDVDFDQRTKEDVGRDKVYPSSIKVIENNITPEIREEQTTNIKDDINRAIASGKTNPKQVAQTIVEKTKTKEYRAPIKKALGKWNSEQYNNNIDKLINKAFIKTLPIAQIKRRFGKLFNIKEINRVPTVKIENGKRTDFKKPVYLIPAINDQKLNEIKNYFKATEKRHQSLMSLIAEGIAVEQMEEIKSDKKFMKDLQGRLEIKNSNLTANQFMDELIFNLDKRNLEDKSFDVAKASKRKNKVQRITGKPQIDLSSGSYETNIDKITTALDNVQGVPLVSGSRVEKGKDEKFGVMYEWTAIIPNVEGKTDYEGAQTYGDVRNEMVIDLIESFSPKDRPMVRQLIFDMSTNQLFVSGKPGQIEGADKGNLALYGAKSEFDKAIPKYPNVKNKKGKDITTPIITRKRYTDGDKKITNKIWRTLTSKSFQTEQDRKIPILFKLIDGLNKLKGNKNFPWFIKALTASVTNSQKHPFRHLMPLRNVQIDPTTGKPFNETYREEHSFVANNLGKLIEYGILSNQLPIVKDIIEASASQAALTEATDNKLPKSKTSAMGAFFSKVIEGIIKGERQAAFQGIISFSRYMEDGLLNIGEFWNLKENKLLVDVLGFDLKGINNNADSRNARTNLINKVLEDKLTIPKAQAELKAPNKVNAKSSKRVKLNKENLFDLINEDGTTEASIEAMSNADKAAFQGRKIDKPTKGISVFDFDDTLAFSNSKVIVTVGNKTFKITPAEFAQQSEVLEREGATFDFKEFNKVVKGKKGPLADLALKRQNKFGSGDIFVLTARPQASAKSIQKFLKGIGLDIPLKNITGLENGSPQAKALWILDKAAKGYNDFYFADDSLANVQAVENILDQIDVKSDVQIAKQSKRKRIDKEFNTIIEQQSGKQWYKTYSKARAKTTGRKVGTFEFFIPPSAEDFSGLLYKILPKGEKGNLAKKWLKDNLFDPFNEAEQQIISAKISVAKDFQALRKNIDNIPKNLNKQVGVGNFTYSQALRVYIWNMQGMEVPGLSTRDLNRLVDKIESDSALKVFAEKIAFIQKGKQYPKPGDNWVAGSITTDIIQNLNKAGRKEALQEWQENVDIIFSDKNLNKLEALYGSNFILALKNSLSRMKSGSNRPIGMNPQVNNLLDWLNNSVGAVMFLNMRSATLQLISSVNFLNWSDNNPVAAARAFANQKQYWSDVMTLLNSDYLVQRRNGLKINVAESEIAEAARKGGMKGAIAYLLNKGFLLTRFADSMAIATGGASFYRNRVNALLKQVNIDTGSVYTKAEAEAKAFDDFYQISEESQQSSRTDRISMQQASSIGRLILNFANTPMQYARIMKKSALDLANGRGDWKTNLSKIVYYGFIQNLIFNAMQQAIFALAFGSDDEEERTAEDRAGNIANGMVDSILRGLGYGGAAVATVKDVIIKLTQQGAKKNPKYEDAVSEVFNFSPAIDSKVRKLRSAAKTFSWNRKEIKSRGFNLDNPAYLSIAQIISATTNIPLDRAARIMMNLKQAVDKDTEIWQRVALMFGYSGWELGLPYWGLQTTIDKEEEEKENIKTKYKNEASKLKTKGYKRIPMTKGKPDGKLNVDFIQVARPTGDLEYWLMPKK